MISTRSQKLFRRYSEIQNKMMSDMRVKETLSGRAKQCTWRRNNTKSETRNTQEVKYKLFEIPLEKKPNNILLLKHYKMWGMSLHFNRKQLPMEWLVINQALDGRLIKITWALIKGCANYAGGISFTKRTSSSPGKKTPY